MSQNEEKREEDEEEELKFDEFPLAENIDPFAGVIELDWMDAFHLNIEMIPQADNSNDMFQAEGRIWPEFQIEGTFIGQFDYNNGTEGEEEFIETPEGVPSPYTGVIISSDGGMPFTPFVFVETREDAHWLVNSGLLSSGGIISFRTSPDITQWFRQFLKHYQRS